MEYTINGITYNVAQQDTNSVVTFNSTSFMTHGTPSVVMSRYVLDELIRPTRDSELTASDWRMTTDYPYDDQTEWQTYRQALRELPNNYVLGTDIVFPVPPST